jgi:hypothetical protein
MNASDGRPADRPLLTPVTSASARTPLHVAAVALLLVGLAVAKPWTVIEGPSRGAAAGENTGGSVHDASAASHAPGQLRVVEATALADHAEDPDTIPCSQPDGWRLVTAESSTDGVVRSWSVVTPAVARGPVDARLTPFILADTNVVGLGFCGNDQGPGADPAMIVEAWRAPIGNGWSRVAFAAWTGRTDDGASAIVYRPDDATTWASGRYAFSVSRGNDVVWLRLDLIWPPVDRAAATRATPPPASVDLKAPGASSLPRP